MSPSKTYILDDLPTDRDTLDFTPYVATLADICKTASTPLTIGVFGTWGSGKTSLMRMVKKKLPKNYTAAWFDAWKYDNEETLWRAFLLTVLLAVEEKSGETEELKTLKTMLYRGLELEKTGGVTIDLAKLGAKVAQGAVQIGLSFIPPLAQLTKLVEELQKAGLQNIGEESVDAIRRERTKIYIEQVRSLEQFQEKFKTLIESYVAPGRLVVFVDDLDRCLPEKAVEVLEAIKLFVDVPGCVFLLGLDQEVIARGVEIRYKEFSKTEDGETRNPIDGAKYLEKIIQLPFQIPPIESGDMGDFVSGLVAEWPRPECPEVFARGLGGNPRQVKRTVNTFLMLWGLAEKRRLREMVQPIRLAKVVAIQTAAPRFYELLKRNHALLRDVEAYYRAEGTARGEGLAEESAARGGKRTAPQETPSVQLPQDLLTLLNRTPAVAQIVKLFPDLPEANFTDISYDELEAYFTLTRRAEAPQPVQAQAAPLLPFEPQMVKILAGPFLMGSTPEQAQRAIKDGADKDWVKDEQPQHTVELAEYFIGKYPVTNQQYQAFVKEGGKPPSGWDGDQFPQGKDAQPVVNVSWEDAVAYCKWLNEKTKKKYRLPTEAEWEKAARGEDGRIWSWGNEFGEKNANTLEAGIRDTTPVGQFSPQGDSPYGCADMVGNVWEWTHSLYEPYPYKADDGREDESASGSRVLRGGSFNNNSRNARGACRYRYLPDSLYYGIGFRVAASLAERPQGA
ncbi:MAG: SUMF1/EgtB/PvdO family nonheme iron enzyme [Chloroflexi bacterium]|nr:SUMF1/EgtB/PvdO family nonheme iron enzyme [Chloroflexota bacterium]